MCVLEFKDRPGAPVFHLENFIEGHYIKYNSNSGYVSDEKTRLTPQVSKKTNIMTFLKRQGDLQAIFHPG